MPDKDISPRTRKRLWLRSGGTCAYPGCPVELLEPTPDGGDETIVGIEFHIVSRKDDPSVARSVSSLSDDARLQFAHLIENRHGFENLVIMCPTHSRLVDTPAQDRSVAWMVEVKASHEAAVAARKSPGDLQREADVLWYLGITEEWESRARLDAWEHWVGPLVADGHPHMTQADFDALTETRNWIFTRTWPQAIPEVEDAFENFRHVAQDLQGVLSQHPHKHLQEQGVVAIARFYNDSRYWGSGNEEPDFQRLDDMYDFYAFLVEDLAYELTRAANLICHVVRRHLLPDYRAAEGVLTLTAGPFIEDLTIRTARPAYAADAGSAPYEGLDGFLEGRAGRDIVRGSGGRPRGVRLPGDSVWGA